MNPYRLNLSMLGSETENRHHLLEDDYFASLEQDEVRGGHVEVVLQIHPAGDAYDFRFAMKGMVRVVCDRCLDELELPVEAEDSLRVKTGAEADEETDSVTVDERTGVYDYAWRMFETIVLALPTERVHKPGDCNPEMMELINAHAVRTIVDENDEL